MTAPAPTFRRHVRFASAFLTQMRDVTVYLPPGYDTSGPLPVLYLHDGQNLFEPQRAFPMATSYAVEVPAGTRSASGSALAAAVKWTFDTPPPSLADKYPNGIPVRRRPVLVGSTDEQYFAARPPQVARVDVGRQHGSDQVPQVLHAVDVRKCAGDEHAIHDVIISGVEPGRNARRRSGWRGRREAIW